MDLQRTPLYGLHTDRGGRMVEFAGYEMPIRYEDGIIAEHLQTRSAASLFDVGHMGVIEVWGHGAAEQLERLVPSAIVGLPHGKLRYTFFTNDQGGVIDDLMVTNAGDRIVLVVNAGTKAGDLEHLQSHLDVEVRPRPDLSLLALQGPAAESVLSGLTDAPVATQPFMTSVDAEVGGVDMSVSRSGYTGEDGFELMLPSDAARSVAERLLSDPDVELAGLGARDSLRLEAGLCLYGHDLDATTTPVEAALVWAMQKRRRTEGGFPGFDIIRRQLDDGPSRLRVGLRPDGRAPVREGAELHANGSVIGVVTSGGYGPSVEAPVAMGYVAAEHADAGTELTAHQRNKSVKVTVSDLPFIQPSYYRGETA